MVRLHHQLNGHELSKLQKILKDRGAWRATVHEVTKHQTWLSNWAATTTMGPVAVKQERKWLYGYTNRHLCYISLWMRLDLRKFSKSDGGIWTWGCGSKKIIDRLQKITWYLLYPTFEYQKTGLQKYIFILRKLCKNLKYIHTYLCTYTYKHMYVHIYTYAYLSLSLYFTLFCFSFLNFLFFSKFPLRHHVHMYFIYIYTHIYVIYIYICMHMSFSGGTCGKEPTCQCRRHKRGRFDSWVGKMS